MTINFICIYIYFLGDYRIYVRDRLTRESQELLTSLFVLKKKSKKQPQLAERERRSVFFFVNDT